MLRRMVAFVALAQLRFVFGFVTLVRRKRTTHVYAFPELTFLITTDITFVSTRIDAVAL